MVKNLIFEIAPKVSTPLILGGVVVSVTFLIFRQIINKDVFPKLTVILAGSIIHSIINKLFILAIIAIVLGFVGYVVATFAPVAKQPADSITISLPSGMSFQNAVKMIAANDSHTVVFSNCTEVLLNTKVESGEFRAKTSRQLIEALQYRLIHSGKATKYRVEHFRDRGIYEIRCD